MEIIWIPLNQRKHLKAFGIVASSLCVCARRHAHCTLVFIQLRAIYLYTMYLKVSTDSLVGVLKYYKSYKIIR